jgi:hypothetical protein
MRPLAWYDYLLLGMLATGILSTLVLPILSMRQEHHRRGVCAAHGMIYVGGRPDSCVDHEGVLRSYDWVEKRKD